MFGFVLFSSHAHSKFFTKTWEKQILILSSRQKPSNSMLAMHLEGKMTSASQVILRFMKYACTYLHVH